MATKILVNIDSDNGLLPYGNKPLPDLILTSHEWGTVLFTSEQFHRGQRVDTQDLYQYRMRYYSMGEQLIPIAEFPLYYTYYLLRHWGREKWLHFLDNIFKYLFWMKMYYSIKISLKFVLKVRINNIPALVQIMAWCQPGHKPLSEPMMVS